MSRRVTKHPHAGLTGYRHSFVKLVHELVRDGGRNHGQVFEDFLELAYCTIAKTTYPAEHERAAQLEARYMRVASNREAAYVRRMPELFALTQLGVHAGGDFLGAVAGDLGALSERLGQFFTPFTVSKMMAAMSLHDAAEILRERGYITVGEPACGAGGMLLAVAEVLAEQGYDPSTSMLAQAADLSATAYQMAYIQLSARGIPADVIHGDSLSLETFESAITPAKFTFMHYHAAGAALAPVRAAAALVAAAEREAAPHGRAQQIELAFGEGGSR